MNQKQLQINGFKAINTKDFIFLSKCSDGFYKVNENGVKYIFTTLDHKVEFIAFENRTIAYISSSMGYPAYYPVHDTCLDFPVKAVLMDLDGTTVRSESFWIWIIEKTCQSLMGRSHFEFEDSDIPFVSGNSVSEHLQYCISKYCPEKTIEEAREYYFMHTHNEMEQIMIGKGRKNAFIPTEGIKDFLLELKSKKIKIGLVTSGLYEKAYPEILSSFQTLNMGDPKDFYDAIITAGYPLKKGSSGTLGELCPKPHPWLYAETARMGLGMSFEERKSIIGIEDSSAGICSIKLAGFSAIGISGGNIIDGGSRPLCDHYCDSFEQILDIIK